MTAIPTQLLADLEALDQALAQVRANVAADRETALRNSEGTRDRFAAEGWDLDRLAQKAATIYAGRRAREQVFGGLDLFGEAAWDIMLDLFVATVRDRAISVSSASIASCRSATSGLRWVNVLIGDGLLFRVPDAGDGRRHHLRLSERGMSLMSRAIEAS